MCRTDTPTRTACRAPGVIPAMFAVEVFMDHVAAAGNFDPAALRRLNLAQENQVTPYGQTLTYCSLPALWDSFVASDAYTGKQAAVAAFNAANRWRKRGIAVQPTKYGIAQGGAFYGAHVSVQAYDGSVMLSSGGTEMGQGLNTKLIQAAAYTLGVDVSLVSVEATDSFVTPNSMCSGGSITSEMCVAAVLDACNALKQRMEPARAAFMATARSADPPTWLQLVDQWFVRCLGMAHPARRANRAPHPLIHRCCCGGSQLCLGHLPVDAGLVRAQARPAAVYVRGAGSAFFHPRRLWRAPLL